MPDASDPSTEHEFRTIEGRVPALTARQLRKLRSYARTNPRRTIRIVSVVDTGTVHVSVLPVIDGGHVNGPRAATLSPEGRLRWL